MCRRCLQVPATRPSTRILPSLLPFRRRTSMAMRWPIHDRRSIRCNTNGKSIQPGRRRIRRPVYTTSSSWSMTTGRRHGRFPDHAITVTTSMCRRCLQVRQQDRQREYCPLFYPFGDGRQWRCAGLFHDRRSIRGHTHGKSIQLDAVVYQAAYTTVKFLVHDNGTPVMGDSQTIAITVNSRQCSARAFRPRPRLRRKDILLSVQPYRPPMPTTTP